MKGLIIAVGIVIVIFSLILATVFFYLSTPIFALAITGFAIFIGLVTIKVIRGEK